MKYYTGVGSRETPKEILDVMEKLEIRLCFVHNFTLRSGGAEGADNAFWKGACQAYSEVMAEIYIPWEGFNNCKKCQPEVIVASELPSWSRAMHIASEIHPAWDRLTQGGKSLHTRNIMQVLGKDLDTPSKFLVCYAKPSGDSVQRGTRTAWECAKMNNIPCFNLYREEDLNRIKKFLGE